MQARMDRARAETSFVKGRSLYLRREEAPYRSLVSLESSTYQGLMYRVRVALVLSYSSNLPAGFVVAGLVLWGAWI